MAKKIILGAKTSHEARELLFGARWASRQPTKFRSGVPRRNPGNTLSKATKNVLFHQYAVIVEPIGRTSDVSSDPSGYVFGKIRINGKQYPSENENGDPIEPGFDDCVCLDLADTEELLAGTTIEIDGPFQRKNPDYDPNNEESTEPEQLDYYYAVNTEGAYTGILADELSGTGGSTTIQIKDAKGKLTTFTIHSYYLGQYQKIESGTGVMVARQQTESGRRLVVVKSRSAITQTDTT